MAMSRRTIIKGTAAGPLVAVGCEDLSFHGSATTDWKFTESVIWNLSEYAGGRYVYAVRADGS
ncbi:hypothetical protein [Kitasatospora sp. NPDC008115]|uniref:hypothetical protein n=1 Tax=Kitasatospora sp. NPDC008115 TaxID=3364022 RepID=UPI0036E01477